MLRECRSATCERAFYPTSAEHVYCCSACRLTEQARRKNRRRRERVTMRFGGLPCGCGVHAEPCACFTTDRAEPGYCTVCGHLPVCHIKQQGYCGVPLGPRHPGQFCGNRAPCDKHANPPAFRRCTCDDVGEGECPQHPNCEQPCSYCLPRESGSKYVVSRCSFLALVRTSRGYTCDATHACKAHAHLPVCHVKPPEARTDGRAICRVDGRYRCQRCKTGLCDFEPVHYSTHLCEQCLLDLTEAEGGRIQDLSDPPLLRQSTPAAESLAEGLERLTGERLAPEEVQMLCDDYVRKRVLQYLRLEYAAFRAAMGLPPLDKGER